MSIKTRERDVEQHLVTSLGKINLPCIKFDPTNRIGMPDRIVLLPDGKVIWVELKTKGGSLEEIQKLRHAELQRLGHPVVVLWDKDDVDNLIEGIKEELEC